MEEENLTRFTLRLPKILHGLLLQHAEMGGRSLNAEIIARLEASFRGGSKLEDIQAALYTLHDALARSLPIVDSHATEKKAPEPPPQGE